MNKYICRACGYKWTGHYICSKCKGEGDYMGIETDAEQKARWKVMGRKVI